MAHEVPLNRDKPKDLGAYPANATQEADGRWSSASTVMLRSNTFAFHHSPKVDIYLDIFAQRIFRPDR